MKLHAMYIDGCLVLQLDEYIEDGWYITHENGTSTWALHEIPEGGGEQSKARNYPNIDQAISAALDLT